MQANDPMYLIRLEPIQVVFDRLNCAKRELELLRPHNGTVVGARAIAETRAKIDMLQAELNRRADLNNPDQED